MSDFQYLMQSLAQITGWPIILREAFSFVEPKARQKQMETRLELTEEIPSVPADAFQVEQVALNLIRNGIEAMDDPAVDQQCLTIQTSLTDDKTAVEVTIRDTGVGFDPENTEQLFNSFYTTKDKGLGIGLSLSRSIIESLGGRLWAVSNPEGGATFRFTLLLKCEAAPMSS